MKTPKRWLAIALAAACMTAVPSAAAPGARQEAGRARRVRQKAEASACFADSGKGFAGQGALRRVEIPEVRPAMREAQFTAYAYCACGKCCGKWARGITASGTTAAEGRTIAVDPEVIPLGTHVFVDGREYIAEDTGSGIDGRTIDIFFGSHRAALQWGKRQVTVRWPAD